MPDLLAVAVAAITLAGFAALPLIAALILSDDDSRGAHRQRRAVPPEYCPLSDRVRAHLRACVAEEVRV